MLHSTLCFSLGNSDIYKNNGISLWNFFLKSGLRKFHHGISIIELSLRKMDAQSVINWTVVVQLTWQYLRRSTPVVYRRDRHVLSTARFRRADQLATDDTCEVSKCGVYCRTSRSSPDIAGRNSWPSKGVTIRNESVPKIIINNTINLFV